MVALSHWCGVFGLVLVGALPAACGLDASGLLASTSGEGQPVGTPGSASASSASGASGSGGGGGTGGGGASGTVSGSGGAGTGGGDGGAGGAVGEPCVINAWVENFDNSAVDPPWFAYGDPPVQTTELTGSLQIVFPTTQNKIGGQGWGGMAQSLLECSTHIEIKLAPASNNPILVFFTLGSDDKNYLGMSLYLGKLSVGHTLGGVQSFNNTVDFDAVNHRFWRMRESGGTTFFETSPDAGSWTTVHSLPTPSFVNNVAVNFGALVGNSGTLDGIVQFDNLNVVP